MMDYHKKIVPYLDGSLSADERSEFEAYVHTHPDFESEIEAKRQEVETLKASIPAVSLSKRALDSLDAEIKQSVFNLLKEEPKSFWDSVKIRLDDWLSR